MKRSLSVRAKRIYLSTPHMGGGEMRFIEQAFESNWIAPLGENVDLFEKMLSEKCDSRPAVALSSGTAALHLALIRLGVGPGDTVLCQSFTFCASANPIRYLGATPVFIGSELETWNASPEALEQAIIGLRSRGVRPKAFVYVHLYGVPANASKILEVCRRFEVPTIEDAAESLGSTIDGVPTGTFGNFSVLSFNGNKIITTSGGGALLCSSREEAQKVKFLASQARDAAPYYLHSQIGYNYRLSNVLAGIGCGQVEVLDERVARRRSVYDRYKNELQEFGEIEFLESIPGNFENRWLTTITLQENVVQRRPILEIVRTLESRNIECRPLWNPLHAQPVFAGCEYFGDSCELRLFERGLCLPSSSNLSQDDQTFVIEALVEAVGLK